MVNLRTNAAFHHLASSRHQANFLPGRHYRRKMIARCITSCRERNGNAAPRSNRGWWPRLEYLDRRRDQVDAVPPSLQAAPDGGRSRYKTSSSEERRVGKECVSTCRSWRSPYPPKKQRQK